MSDEIVDIFDLLDDDEVAYGISVSIPTLVRRGREEGWTEVNVREEVQRLITKGNLILDVNMRVRLAEVGE